MTDDNELTDITGAIELRDEVLGNPEEIGGTDAIDNSGSADSSGVDTKTYGHWLRVMLTGKAHNGAQYATWERLEVLLYLGVLVLAAFTALEVAVELFSIRSGPVWEIVRLGFDVRVWAFDVVQAAITALLQNSVLMLLVAIITMIGVSRSLREKF